VILTQGDDDNQRAEIAKDLGTYVRPDAWPKVTLPPVGSLAQRWRRAIGRTDDRWIAASFNAWQNEHVVPYWWNFYIEVREELLAPYWWPRRVWYWVTERVWRIVSRDIVPQALSLLVLVSAVYLLYRIVSPDTLRAWLQGSATVASGQASTAGQGLLALLLLTVAGGSGLKLLGSFRSGTEWVIRATGDGGDSQVLGRGDPLHGFSAHFRRFCASLDQPILIVIDDLDRCQPAYVVELIRGLMTVFNSPRIVYLILGDRRWIETCFAKAYAAMAEAEAKPASFGSRFAEKSTQLSFLLPSVPAPRVAAYVDVVLGRQPGTNPIAERATAEAVAGIVGLKSQSGRDMALRAAMAGVASWIPIEGERDAAKQAVREAAAIEAARSPAAADEIGHYLQDLHALMPNNPRQIKRIVNMVALYQASALAALEGYEQGGEKWRRMVLWVLLMGSEPGVWRILNDDPGRADKLAEETDTEIARFWVSPLRSLFEGGLPLRFADTRLDAQSIRELQRLMPQRYGR